MQQVQFDRDSMAHWYAQEHLKADPGVRKVYYLPSGAPEREIRLVEVNDMIGERSDDSLAPIDFGVDRGDSNEHTLIVLDVTPAQLDRIIQNDLSLPRGWSLQNSVSFN
jgi:hypothetical protein